MCKLKGICVLHLAWSLLVLTNVNAFRREKESLVRTNARNWMDFPIVLSIALPVYAAPPVPSVLSFPPTASQTLTHPPFSLSFSFLFTFSSYSLMANATASTRIPLTSILDGFGLLEFLLSWVPVAVARSSAVFA